MFWERLKIVEIVFSHTEWTEAKKNEKVEAYKETIKKMGEKNLYIGRNIVKEE